MNRKEAHHSKLVGMMDMKRLIHELQTQRIELELQNEELRHAEYRLKQAAKRYGDLYDFAPVGYLTMTRDAVIREINLKGAASLQKDRIQLIGSVFYDFIYDGYREIFQRHLQDVIGKSEKQTCKLRLMTQSSEPFYGQIESVAWHEDETGEVLVRSILSDITSQTRIEGELIHAKEKAEQASLAKSQFLANMSHEMRTPLAVILGYSELALAEKERDPSLSHPLRAIKRNGEHLLQLIDDILDISRVEAGQMVIALAPSQPEIEVRQLVDSMQPKAEAKGLSLNLIWKKNIPPTILTDTTRLRQILLNILSNAIKFTERGGITIEASAVPGPDAETPWLLQFDVQDSGCGIPASSYFSLFKPFSQADASDARKFGGIGLGLYLSRRLAQALGGDVSLLESEVGSGSTFRVCINMRAVGDGLVLATQPKSPRLEHSELQGVSVLLVEDSPDVQLMVRSMLELAGGTVFCANDGVHAISLALEKSIDLILMDLQLPLLDGYKATLELRRLHFAKPILALTAHAFHEERHRVLHSSEFDGFLTKPIGFKPLVDTVKKWAHQERDLRKSRVQELH
ncbi:MAG TPA: ATP-binding protein [Oligoflexus sp.]|uniref:ATP-binding protein n=1 Tax=Oligoflexus sp. TaxID=1971216 RepID=UPI002D80FF8D|nr:ATP-binding protein [Oligoflexus sp.]HET9240052.1 ATP-binding protein [Oligoflexus sp.]